MKKKLILLLLTLSMAAWSQTTPNLHFNVPAQGTQNWGTLINNNFTSIDLLLSGNSPLPGLNVSGTLTLSGVSGLTQCLHVNSAGVVSGTGTDCGSGGSVNFSAVGAGTNVNALVIGSGGSLSYAGSGIVNANELAGTPIAGVTGTGTTVVLSVSPTLTGTALANALTLSGTLTTNLTGGPFCVHELNGVLSATAGDCGSSGGTITSVGGTAPVASSGGTAPVLSLQNSASINVTAALGTDTKYYTASGAAAVNGDVITGDAQGGIADSGTLLSSLAPKANPTFTGTVTLPNTNVPSGATLTIQSGGTLTCAGGSTCPSGATSGTAPIAVTGGVISLQNSAAINVTAALGTDTKYFTASGVAATNGGVITGDAQGGINDSGTLLSALAPKANPTFTGTVNAAAMTLTGTLTTNLTGGPFCVHETSGVLSATGSDCGAGGGATIANTVLLIRGDNAGNGLAGNVTALLATYGNSLGSCSANWTGAVGAVSLAACPVFKGTLTGSVTSLSFTNMDVGPKYTIWLIQDGTGGHGITGVTGVSNLCAVTQAASTTTYMTGTYDGTNFVGDSCSNTGPSLFGGYMTAGGFVGTPPTGDYAISVDSTNKWPWFINDAGTLGAYVQTQATSGNSTAGLCTSGYFMVGVVNKTGAPYCLQPAGGSSVWSALTNPSGNLALSMAGNTSTFTYASGLAGAFKWENTTGANSSSPQLKVCGELSSSPTCYTMQYLTGGVGSGIFPTDNFVIANTGGVTGAGKPGLSLDPSINTFTMSGQLAIDVNAQWGTAFIAMKEGTAVTGGAASIDLCQTTPGTATGVNNWGHGLWCSWNNDVSHPMVLATLTAAPTAGDVPVWAAAGVGGAKIADSTLSYLSGVLSAATGYQINGAAPNNHCLLGNGTNYVDSSSCGSGNTYNGSGISGFSASPTFTGTQYIPLWGSVAPNGTESTVQTKVGTEPITIAHQCASIPGIAGASSVTFSLQANGSPAGTPGTVTMVVNSSTAVCDDTNSYTTSSGDLLDWKTVTSGTPGAATVTVVGGQSGTGGVTGSFTNTQMVYATGSTGLASTPDFTFASHTITAAAAGILDLSGCTGTNCFKIPVKAGCTVSAAGAQCFDSTNKNSHDYTNNVDSVRATWPASGLPANFAMNYSTVSSGNTQLTPITVPAAGSPINIVVQAGSAAPFEQLAITASSPPIPANPKILTLVGTGTTALSSLVSNNTSDNTSTCTGTPSSCYIVPANRRTCIVSVNLFSSSSATMQMSEDTAPGTGTFTPFYYRTAQTNINTTISYCAEAGSAFLASVSAGTGVYTAVAIEMDNTSGIYTAKLAGCGSGPCTKTTFYTPPANVTAWPIGSQGTAFGTGALACINTGATSETVTPYINTPGTSSTDTQISGTLTVASQNTSQNINAGLYGSSSTMKLTYSSTNTAAVFQCYATFGLTSSTH